MPTSSLTCKGSVKVQLFSKDGEQLLEQSVNNMIVTTGLASIAERIAIGSTAAMSHIAIGTNTTPANLADTQLGTELARVVIDSKSVSGPVITYIATFGAGVGTGTWAEAGLFNAASSGTMQARTIFSTSFPKGALDSAVVTWTFTQG